MKPRYFTDGFDHWMWDGSMHIWDDGVWADSEFSGPNELLDCINAREITEEDLP